MRAAAQRARAIFVVMSIGEVEIRSSVITSPIPRV